VKIVPFSSDRKRMSTIYKVEQGYRLFSKGAPDLMLDKCKKYIGENGIE